MQKLIASTIMVIILTGTIVVLLSSCSLLINQDFSTAPSNDFSGNVIFQKIGKNPVSAESHYAMGCHFQKRKKHDWAIEEFQAAVSNQPNYVEAYNRLGVSYDLIGAFDKALAAYEAALSVNPDLDYVHNNMGYSFMLQGKYDLAVASFQKAIALKPEKSRYRNNLASAYIKSGQDSAAIAAFNATSDEAKAHLKVARVLYHDGEYEKAEAYYKKAARLNPEDRQVEKELTAAENLAKINAHTETDDKTVDETIAESHQGNRNRYGEDGFYIVPTEPVEELDNNDIVVVSISESNPVNAFDTAETTYFIGAVAPVKSSELTDEAKRGKLSIDPQQLLEENELRDFYGLDAANIRPGGLKRMKIEVANGNGVRHMARQVGHFIQDRTLILMYLSNADHFNYGRTSIYYTPGTLQEALRVAQKLPGLQQMQEKTAIREGNADISILIGQDLVPHLDALKDS
jgi:Flp pilus assembly protein TadD